jgi:hypothetical protein
MKNVFFRTVSFFLVPKAGSLHSRAIQICNKFVGWTHPTKLYNSAKVRSTPTDVAGAYFLYFQDSSAHCETVTLPAQNWRLLVSAFFEIFTIVKRIRRTGFRRRALADAGRPGCSFKV